MAVKWLEVALNNMADIAEYIARDNPTRPRSFVQEFREKTRNLETFPSLGRAGKVSGTRELGLHENYIATYRLGRSGDVEILRVHHVAQKSAMMARPKILGQSGSDVRAGTLGV